MPDRSKHELQYQAGSSPVTRGQARLLLLLMLIQVLMTAQANYAPGIVASLKSAWAEHQQAVANRAALQKTLAAERLAAAYAPPPAQVIWEEDPDRAARLLAAGGYRAVSSVSPEPAFFIQAIPPVACLIWPATVPGCVFTSGPNATFAFMHERQAGNQPARLVKVALSGSVAASQNGGHPAEDPFDGTIAVARSLSASSYGTADEGVYTNNGPSETELSLQPEENGTYWNAHWTPAQQAGNPGKLNIQYHDVLRIFAGQADPADAAHFTIGYELDGKAGVIDGWLKANGSVALEPREGKRVETLWYPHAK